MRPLTLPDTRYLKQRRGRDRSGHRWYLRIAVPADLCEQFGTGIIERALNTSDFKKAQKLRYSMLAEIHADFDRARLGKITSADIEHEARRYLREQLDLIQAKPGDTVTDIVDDRGNNYGPGGDAVLGILRNGLADGDWSHDVNREAENIARKYGVTLNDAQREELCHALQLAEIEALSRILTIHQGEIPTPRSVLNAHAVDPVTTEVRQPTRPAPRQGKGIRVREASEAYIAYHNREQRSAWTGQTQGQSRTTFRLFRDFTRDAPLETITRNDIAGFLSKLSQLDQNYGRKKGGKNLSLNKLLEIYPAKNGSGLKNRTLNRHVAVIAGMFDWAITAGRFDRARGSPAQDRPSHNRYRGP